MLLAMTCHLAFPQTESRPPFEIRKIVSAEVETSWDVFTDKAEVVIPAKWNFQNKRISIRDFLKAGDSISISIGYGAEPLNVFNGYISKVSSGVPLQLECEDEMYLLKRTKVNGYFQDAKLKDMLAQVVPQGIDVEALDVSIGNFKASKTTVTKVLDKLKEKFGFVSYMRGKTLYCGKVHIGLENKPVASFSFEQDILENDLEYRNESDTPVKVRAISNLLDGNKIEVELGDEDGEERTLNYFNIKSESELEKIANVDLEKFKVSGYRGSFKTYLLKHIRHGDIVSIESNEYPERNGEYFVDGVDYQFSQDGGRQVIKLGRQV